MNLQGISSIEYQYHAGRIFAGGSSGVVYAAYSNDPYNWTSISSPTSETIIHVQDFSSQDSGAMGVGLVDRLGGFWTTAESTSNWSNVGSLTIESISAAYIWGQGSWEVVSEDGRILQNTAMPYNTVDITGNFGAVARGVAHNQSSVTNINAVGNSGTAKFCTGPASWGTVYNLGTTENILDVRRAGSPSSPAMIVVSEQGSIIKSTNLNAGAFTAEVTGIPYSINGVYLSRAKYIIGGFAGALACGDNGLIMRRR